MHVGLHKGSPGEFTCTQSLSMGSLLDVRRGSECVFWGPSFQSTARRARVIFRVALKERTRRVQLHVGLRKGSPEEFTSTQSLPLGALLDGRKGLGMHFLGPEFSVFSYAG